MSNDDLTIQTNGATLGGWQEVEVRRGVTSCPSVFSVELTERYPGDPTEAVVTPGSTCKVFLGGDLVINGYIDRYNIKIDAETHRVQIVGRSRVEDAVDCSVDTDALGAWSFRGGKLGALVQKILAPYNIGLQLPDGDVDLPDIVFSVQPGETIYSLIKQLARAVDRWVWDNANGDMVISRGGTNGRAGSALVEGQNIEAGDAGYGMDQRFSKYRVGIQGQDSSHGHFSVYGNATDNGVPRPRLKMLMAEGPLIGNYQDIRAQWEASRRYGQSRVAHVIVTGWRDGAGALWAPNSVVAVKSDTLKIDEDRVIAEAVWSRDDAGGTRTQLTLIPPEGMVVQPFFPVDIFGAK